MTAAPVATGTRRGAVATDPLLVASALALAAVGVVAVYASTRQQLMLQGIDPHYLMKHQIEYAIVGTVVMAVMARIDYHLLENVSWIVYGLLLASLLATFVIGSQALGAVRWIQFGPVQVQPSAFGAVLLTVVIAAYCSRTSQIGGRQYLTWKDLGVILLVSLIPILLVIKQPDLGSGMVMLVVLLVMLVVGGLPNRYTVLLVIAGALAAFAAIKLGLLHHYQLQRLTSFVGSSKSSSAAYNAQQSKAAIGSGGLFGTGLFHGMQVNLAYLPEAQTDFIFSVIGEELGFIGAVVVLGLSGIVVWRMARIARAARDLLGKVLVAGCIALVGFSVFENAGMAVGIMPVAGIPLPFVSYGGSALVAFFLAVGIALSVRARTGRLPRV